MIGVPDGNGYDYEKLHGRGYIDAPVEPADVKRRLHCRCERRSDRLVHVERVQEYGRTLVVINCVTCGKAIPGIPR